VLNIGSKIPNLRIIFKWVAYLEALPLQYYIKLKYHERIN
jgi:hypothetical protein